MSRIWKFLFFLTWIVIIGLLIFLAISLSNKQSQTQQQTINQYVTKGNGLSAYQIAVKEGFEGTEKQWLASLNGKDSTSTKTVVEKRVETQKEVQTKVIEQVPVHGKSSYDIWLSLGNVGSEQDYIDSLKGDDAPTVTNQMRFNEDTGKFQVKLSTDTWWRAIPVCGGTSGKACN